MIFFVFWLIQGWWNLDEVILEGGIFFNDCWDVWLDVFPNIVNIIFDRKGFEECDFEFMGIFFYLGFINLDIMIDDNGE